MVDTYFFKYLSDNWFKWWPHAVVTYVRLASSHNNAWLTH